MLPQLIAALDAAQTVYLITLVDRGTTTLKNGSKLLITDTTISGTLGDTTLDAAVVNARSFWLAAIKEAKTDNLTLWSDQLRSIHRPLLNSPALSDAALNTEYQEVSTLPLPRVRLALEIILPPPQLLICGAGHIGRALAQLALILGFSVTVIDDRREFACREFFPDPAITLQVMDFPTAIAQTVITSQTAVVIVTRGHRHDEDCLRMLLAQPAGYIGMIGSRRRIQVVTEKLIAEGFSSAVLSRIYAPIGLDIKARTPQEIALAILAEIVWARNLTTDQIDCRPLSRYRR
jgi:xanthine/CO dehydrogenase XdhC/CoxF family maturation factor